MDVLELLEILEIENQKVTVLDPNCKGYVTFYREEDKEEDDDNELT